jgi:hypothetical protein
VNLAAQSNRATVRDKLSGYKAFSVANAFPQIIIGDSAQDNSSGGGNQTKSFKDEANWKPDNLSPSFFKPYDLDATLPDDNIFTCRIWNHQKKPLLHSVIGENVVDIEDRYWAQEKVVKRAAYSGLMAGISKQEQSKDTSSAQSNSLK